MIESLKESIEDFIENRVSKVLNEICSEEEIKKIQKSIMEMQNEVLENSNEKIQELFIEYEDTVNYQYGIITNKLYRIAFLDAIEILKEL